tara:strand:+ start:170 stop:403 length:234 start_codon:yes stop_codon:yes gene_type:complete
MEALGERLIVCKDLEMPEKEYNEEETKYRMASICLAGGTAADAGMNRHSLAIMKASQSLDDKTELFLENKNEGNLAP